jgi:hypothetical protein
MGDCVPFMLYQSKISAAMCIQLACPGDVFDLAPERLARSRESRILIVCSGPISTSLGPRLKVTVYGKEHNSPALPKGGLTNRTKSFGLNCELGKNIPVFCLARLLSGSSASSFRLMP